MLDKNGFTRKTYSDLLDEMEAKAKELFGENTNTKAYTPLGIILRIFAWFLAIVWDVVERVYNNSFPGTAEGISLDRLSKLKGMTRIKEDYAYGKVQITGPRNTLIEAGFIVGTKNDVWFETTEEIILDETGLGIAEIYCQDAGVIGNVEIGEITEILNPTDEDLSVTNLEPTSGGREKETDKEFYERFQQYPTKSGSSNIESIEAKLLETPGVRDAIVSQNTASVEKNGLPPHCIAPFVFGGNDEEVAQTIFDVAPGGIQVYGTTVIQVKDSKGVFHDIGFTRPTTIQVYVKVQLTKGTDFSSDGIKNVRNQILNYIGGLDESGYEYPGLGQKENVVHAKIVALALNFKGVNDVVVELSRDGINFSQTNITVAANQVAKTTYDKVVVS
ncbi:baseplate J/gp47 family protein [Heyndrickxia sporothermodurans]|uniref:Baseplate J/gp47 family protein n=1 Tax=Heyndrickxia sporothermodurans TaxID=46224 RepID=A0AB37HML9_9BACI|nr:baseplate J/gp47 family protein [Heyndrickxia sporothermodurans]MBL5768234.1 baseplate J/gp47 family protein [Heyndrickxia sporothermodurans]MBL5771013.1 baseplate J/gp47 family protein [Heyndrickxia sporothermodurans]MBL5774691.1 baseplate J/gp47 family protein [Heyndrickxia sporothermodurans]MBL5785388.1 baseplate J/gp47 family protein [Heyndrickxia sporothermodurans]MBL5788875.1 baseplate J/gp47 family protein [Heyndrickxia sporothermodurans]